MAKVAEVHDFVGRVVDATITPWDITLTYATGKVIGVELNSCKTHQCDDTQICASLHSRENGIDDTVEVNIESLSAYYSAVTALSDMIQAVSNLTDNAAIMGKRAVKAKALRQILQHFSGRAEDISQRTVGKLEAERNARELAKGKGK